MSAGESESVGGRCRADGRIFGRPLRRILCGHTEEVAKEHYRKVGQGDLDQTMEKLSKIHSEKLAIKVAIKDDSQGLESSLTVSTTCDDETKKPKESLGFVAICRLLSEAGLLSRMGEEGLEPPTSTL